MKQRYRVDLQRLETLLLTSGRLARTMNAASDTGRSRCSIRARLAAHVAAEGRNLEPDDRARDAVGRDARVLMRQPTARCSESARGGRRVPAARHLDGVRAADTGSGLCRIAIRRRAIFRRRVHRRRARFRRRDRVRTRSRSSRRTWRGSIARRCRHRARSFLRYASRHVHQRDARCIPMKRCAARAFVTCWRQSAVAGDERIALLHGDYWPGNVLWKNGALVGVIDWEDTQHRRSDRGPRDQPP